MNVFVDGEDARELLAAPLPPRADVRVVAAVAGGCRIRRRRSRVPTAMHVPAEIKHLHEVAEKGEAPETPAILVAEVFLFLLPVALVMLAIGFGLYYAFGGPS